MANSELGNITQTQLGNIAINLEIPPFKTYGSLWRFLAKNDVSKWSFQADIDVSKWIMFPNYISKLTITDNYHFK